LIVGKHRKRQDLEPTDQRHQHADGP